MRVKKTDLGTPRFLAEGGFGKVYRVLDYHLPGDPENLAYKEFTKEEAEQGHASQAAVAFRDGLSAAERAELDLYAAWPRAVVEDSGAVVGLLMPLIPDDFFCKLIDDTTGDRASAPREMQWLIASQAVRDAADVDLSSVDKTQRLTLLAQLVYAVGRLHKRGWVFGDLSFKNAVFAVDPPRVMLIDCDGAASVNDLRRKQAHTPFWIPPECKNMPGHVHFDMQDTVTDVYKLGLAILRCLSPGKGAGTADSPARVAHELDADGLDLVARAVGADRGARPTAKELYAYLRPLQKARVHSPEVIAARLATPLRVRGMDARVEWEITNVSEVTIRVGASAPMTVPVTARGGPQPHVFRARESGPVTIEAKNRYGAVRVDLGELILYDIPPFDPKRFIGTLPRLTVPPLDAFTLDALAPALATVPRVQVPELPRLPTMQTAGLTGVLREMLLPTGSGGQPPQAGGIAQSLRFPNFGELVAGPTRQIAEQLTSQAHEFAQSQRESYLKALADAEEDD
ncbi:MAG: Mn2+-dependent serine/threonine protein kinase [Actinomycetia bacterium]|nr:Mn2+-dependent serine/threonine protein kinase [Actinomycetes bacterium]